MTVTRSETIANIGGQLTPLERYTWDGQFEATICWKVAWDDRYTFLDEMSDNGGETYPHGTSDFVRFIGAHVKGFGKPVGVDADTRRLKYDYALVFADYSTRAPRYFGGQPITEELHITSSCRNLDTTDLTWDAARLIPLLGNEAPQRLEYGMDYSITYNGIYSPPAAATSFLNCVNSGVAGSYTLGLSFAIGTLLYMGPQESSVIGVGLIPKIKLTYVFKYRGSDWNYHWRMGTGWVPYYYLGAQVINHPYVNFAAMVP